MPGALRQRCAEGLALWRQDCRVNAEPSARLTLAVWRLGHAAHGQAGPAAFLLRRLHTVLDALWTKGVVGSELPRSVPVGPGLRLPHGGRGIVLHSDVVLGSGVQILHQVTVGLATGWAPEGVYPVPVVEDDVFLGAGCKVLGGITVGRGAQVGAGAVVVKDVPPGATALGPAATVRPGRGAYLDRV